MECRFSTGDVVLINDTAEVAFDYIGQTATVLDTEVLGMGRKGKTTPIEYHNACWVTIQCEDGTVLEKVPDSELSPI
jgi:hypothetical protein